MSTRVHILFSFCQLKCTISHVVDRVAKEDDQLGRELKAARAAAGKSLRSVAEEAGVSPAYVQKLEQGEVAAPSPKRLERLAATLGLDYDRLMAAAGYVVARATGGASPLDAKLAAASLTQTEELAVAAFIDHLTAHRAAD